MAGVPREFSCSRYEIVRAPKQIVSTSVVLLGKGEPFNGSGYSVRSRFSDWSYGDGLLVGAMSFITKMDCLKPE